MLGFEEAWQAETGIAKIRVGSGLLHRQWGNAELQIPANCRNEQIFNF
jgi:hypothetical protein